jgi:hypothetical protein
MRTALTTPRRSACKKGVRIALLLLVVLVVALPTALVPELAYSPQQVRHAFESEGLTLHLTGRTVGRNGGASAPISDQEWYFRSRDHQFSVIVFWPTRMGVRFVPIGGIPSKTASARNVVAVWTPTLIVPAELTRVRAALTHLAAFPTR